MRVASHGIESHGADDGTTMDLLDALATASEEFTRQLALVGDSDWSRSTPCSEWDVRYLVAHLVGGNRFAVSLLGGMSASDAMTEVMSTRQLSDDPLGDYIATSAAQLAAFRVDNPAEQRIDHPLGVITVREFLEFRVFDTTLHAWDLARALAADPHLTPELVDTVLAIVEAGPLGMGFGIIATGNAGPHSTPLERLLDLAGRSAT